MKLELTRGVALIALAATSACADNHTPLQFTVTQDAVVLTGEVDTDSVDAFEDVIDAHPNVRTLVLQNVGGSVDDEANLELGRLVRQLGMTTRVPSTGLVASGGTDLLLAGQTRVLEPGACVGVHAWAADGFTANDLSHDAADHELYLGYYRDLGIDEAFYWFTPQAAPADDMHWMTAAEATRFGVSATSVPPLGSQATCSDR